MTGAEAEQETAPSTVSVPGSTVPPWRDGLPVTVLAPDCQRVLGVLEERRAAGPEPLKVKEIAVGLGLGTTLAKVEGVRSKARRLAERGGSCWKRRVPSAPAGDPWPRQTLAHPRDHRPPDHRLAGSGQGFVTPRQAAGVHQPRERALYHPESGGRAAQSGNGRAVCGGHLARRISPAKRSYGRRRATGVRRSGPLPTGRPGRNALNGVARIRGWLLPRGTRTEGGVPGGLGRRPRVRCRADG